MNCSTSKWIYTKSVTFMFQSFNINFFPQIVRLFHISKKFQSESEKTRANMKKTLADKQIWRNSSRYFQKLHKKLKSKCKMGNWNQFASKFSLLKKDFWTNCYKTKKGSFVFFQFFEYSKFWKCCFPIFQIFEELSSNYEF